MQLLGMLSVLGGLVFVGLEMRQSQQIALAGQMQSRAEQNVVLKYEWLVPKAGLEPARAKLTTPSR